MRRNFHAEAREGIIETVDLAQPDVSQAPYVTTGTPDYSTDEIQEPPSEDDTTRKIAEILIAGGTIYVIAKAISSLIGPLGIEIPSIVAALNMTSGGRNPHRVKPKYVAEGIDAFDHGGAIIKTAANDELYFRAAYILRAAYRIQKKYNAGMSLKAALLAEEKNYKLHQQARQSRTKAALSVAKAYQLYGPVLGWYLNPLLNNEAACIAASGNNFRADTMPLIGFPGLVHPHCGCYAGQPHSDGGWVDDAVTGKFKKVKASKMLRLQKPRERKAS